MDPTVRQFLLQFGYASVGDLCIQEREPPQTRQPLQIHKACIGDLSVVEEKSPKTREPLEVHKASGRVEMWRGGLG